jgi:hypothetical protein
MVERRFRLTGLASSYVVIWLGCTRRGLARVPSPELQSHLFIPLLTVGLLNKTFINRESSDPFDT